MLCWKGLPIALVSIPPPRPVSSSPSNCQLSTCLRNCWILNNRFPQPEPALSGLQEGCSRRGGRQVQELQGRMELVLCVFFVFSFPQKQGGAGVGVETIQEEWDRMAHSRCAINAG